jgi:hypothetical protein
MDTESPNWLHGYRALINWLYDAELYVEPWLNDYAGALIN